MAKTKAELAQDAASYDEVLAQAGQAIRAGDFYRALRLAVGSFDFVDGMMQFRQRYDGQSFATVETIEIVFAYAPVLFAVEALTTLEQFLKTKRRVDRDASDDLGQKLTEARATLDLAHQLWDEIDPGGVLDRRSEPSIARDSDSVALTILATWEQMGCIRRSPSAPATWSLVTDMRAPVLAKCPACGRKCRGPKERLLSDCQCPSCSKSATFAIVEELAPTV